MKDNLDQLTLENFRIFAGSNTFRFTNLNIYTGANNSGKSTIIKAIKLFSDGLRRSDFPSLNLIAEDTNLGGFENLINRHSSKKRFKIGFCIKIAKIDELFSVFYTFMNGKEENDQFRETALFANVEVLNSKGKVFFGIYHALNEEKHNMPSVKFPSETGDPGLVYFCLNVSLLREYLPFISKSDFTTLLTKLDQIKGIDNNWWGEAFNENTYSVIDYDIFTLRLIDFLKDLAVDSYFNLADYEDKNNLFFDDHTSDDSKYIRESYRDFLFNVNFHGFLKEVIQPILTSIKSGLDLFRDDTILHIISDVSQDRLIRSNDTSEYLQRLYRKIDDSETIEFIRESLAFFSIDGVIEINSHLNFAFEVNLITNVATIHQKNSAEKIYIDHQGKRLPIPYQESMKDYESNPKINIADLGKGTSNIIKLILKVASILFKYRDEKNRIEVLPTLQSQSSAFVTKKTILIEEPEAFLHPSWQSKLVDFFVYCLKRDGVQFIIETHSVYLIQRLQFLVAKNEYNHEQATILYFNSNEEKEKYYRINIRKDGILKESFGSGFYDEMANLTVDILNAQNIN